MLYHGFKYILPFTPTLPPVSRRTLTAGRDL